MPTLKNLEAALLTLQAQAMRHYGAIEVLINNPVGLSDHTDYVDEIIKHARGLSECEEAYGSLQKHFVPKPPPVTRVEPRPVQEGPVIVSPENSPTMRRAQTLATARNSREEGSDD